MNRFASQNLFGIKGLNIAWYGLIIASGLTLGALLTMSRAKRRNFSTALIFDFLALAVPLAIVGARLYYVVFEWESYAKATPHKDKLTNES